MHRWRPRCQLQKIKGKLQHTARPKKAIMRAICVLGGGSQETQEELAYDTSSEALGTNRGRWGCRIGGDTGAGSSGVSKCGGSGYAGSVGGIHTGPSDKPVCS